VLCKQKEFDGRRQEKVEGIQEGLAADRSKWLESGLKDDGMDAEEYHDCQED